MLTLAVFKPTEFKVPALGGLLLDVRFFERAATLQHRDMGLNVTRVLKLTNEASQTPGSQTGLKI